MRYVVKCAKCLRILPRTFFYTITPGKQRATKSGVHTYCKDCRKDYNHMYNKRVKNLPRLCSTCVHSKKRDENKPCGECVHKMDFNAPITSKEYAPKWRKRREKPTF